MYRTRILLIRHGHYERVGNLGDTVWSLTTLGRNQAAKTGKRLRDILARERNELVGVYSSPWPRALETATIAARELRIKADTIKIRDFLHEALPLVDPERSMEYGLHPGLAHTSKLDREGVERQVDAADEAFFAWPERRATFVVFTHGNLIRYLVTKTLMLPLDAWNRLDIAHAGITELHVYPQRFSALITFNDTGHLPVPLITTN